MALENLNWQGTVYIGCCCHVPSSFCLRQGQQFYLIWKQIHIDQRAESFCFHYSCLSITSTAVHQGLCSLPCHQEAAISQMHNSDANDILLDCLSDKPAGWLGPSCPGQGPSKLAVSVGLVCGSKLSQLHCSKGFLLRQVKWSAWSFQDLARACWALP